MNKNIQRKLLVITTAAIILLISSCENDLQISQQLADIAAIPQGMGRISINLDEADGRTILPQTPEFSSYAIRFQYHVGGVNDINENVISMPYHKELLPGNWRITVIGQVYMEGVEGLSDGYYPAARGEKDLLVQAGISTPVSVDLNKANMGAKGVFQYEIGLPEEGAGSAVLNILRTNKTVVVSNDLLEAASGSIALDEGYYFVQVVMQSGRVRTKTELIHIYSGYTTVAAGTAWNFNSEAGVYLSLNELSEYLATTPVNTMNNPYLVKLITDWAALSTQNEFLGNLYSVLNGRYVSVDLSETIGVDVIGNTTLFSAARDRLVSLILPNGLTKISDKTFYGCTSLSSLTLPASVSSIGSFAFTGTNALSFILTGSGVLSVDETGKILKIGNTLIAWPSASGQAVVPEGIISIGENAFMGNTKITGLSISSSVNNIPARSFLGCFNLVNFDTSVNRFFNSKNNGTIICTVDGELIAWPSAKNVITVPAGINVIGDEAFYLNSSIVEVYFTDPSNIIKIGQSAFLDCSELRIVDLAGCNIPPVLSLISGSSVNHFDGVHNSLWIFVKAEDVNKYKTAWSKYAGNITVQTGFSTFTVSNSDEWLSAFSQMQNITSDTFDILVTDNFSVEPINVYRNNFMSVTITIRSNNNNEISLNSNGSLFIFGDGVTMVIENITLRGKNNNNAPLVKVNNKGKLILKNGGIITGNTYITSVDETGGAGVYLNGGSFDITGGQISENTLNGTGNNLRGGGVYAVNGSVVSMTGGLIGQNSITNNHEGKGGAQGGGISIFNNSYFEMTDGVIELNAVNSRATSVMITWLMTSGIMVSEASGGGVHAEDSNSFFFLKGGKIRRNNCSVQSGNTTIQYGAAYGGGVFIGRGGNFIMEAGIINGNSVIHSTSTNLTSFDNTCHGAYGGGVGSLDGNIVKTGGIIYGNVTGNDADGVPFRNTAQSDIFGDCGNAVFHDTSFGDKKKLRRNDTANVTHNVNSSISGSTGGWIAVLQTEITIAMWEWNSSIYTSGWMGDSYVRVNINGVDRHNARLTIRNGPGYFRFTVNEGDEIKLYFNNYDRTYAFAAYYTSMPPNPGFNPDQGWEFNDPNGRVLAYKQYGTASIFNNTLLGWFAVSSNKRGINEGEVVIAMWGVLEMPGYTYSKWGSESLKINVNGIDLPQTISKNNNGNPDYYYLPVYSGDVITFHWLTNGASRNCAFALYYRSNQPVPMFDPNSSKWSSSKDPEGRVLVYKQLDSALYNDTFLGSFTVP